MVPALCRMPGIFFLVFSLFDSFEKHRVFLCSFPNRFLGIQSSKGKRLFEIERREKQTGWSK